ncbi:hypothetical protein HU719_006520 [Pseudomonas sp. SWRI107]|uniref:hypothetical protein n=1 Tax=Pseudomonas TaxID=286 RepID=UPI0016486926|nr:MULTISPECIES: hypothetical protein [Pseudomonas]MBC3410668.1 hypothetical protein [Pseudomonas sp. SWRI51]MBV4531059.1 hypothetical protein [Pseudomonas farsensis]
MFSARISAAALCVATLGLGNVALASSQAENHQVAVTIVAMEQVCNKAVPGLNGTVANLLAKEPVEAPLKAEILKVQSEPQYKAEVDGMVTQLSGSPLGKMAVEKGTCNGYAAK